MDKLIPDIFLKYFAKTIDICNDIYKGTEMYRAIISSCWETLVKIVTNAKFTFYSLVAISIGTMGIWVPIVFQLNLSGAEAKSHQDIEIENFAIFMYVVSLLGTLAAEYFIKNKQLDDKQAAVHSFSMFVWLIAIFLSFWALKQPKLLSWHLCVSLWLAISLWMSFTVAKGDFKPSEKTNDKLKGNQTKFGGQGIEL